MVTEPEAAAIYTARYLKAKDGAEFMRVCLKAITEKNSTDWGY